MREVSHQIERGKYLLCIICRLSSSQNLPGCHPPKCPQQREILGLPFTILTPLSSPSPPIFPPLPIVLCAPIISFQVSTLHCWRSRDGVCDWWGCRNPFGVVCQSAKQASATCPPVHWGSPPPCHAEPAALVSPSQDIELGSLPPCRATQTLKQLRSGRTPL